MKDLDLEMERSHEKDVRNRRFAVERQKALDEKTEDLENEKLCLERMLAAKA